MGRWDRYIPQITVSSGLRGQGVPSIERNRGHTGDMAGQSDRCAGVFRAGEVPQSRSGRRCGGQVVIQGERHRFSRRCGRRGSRVGGGIRVFRMEGALRRLNALGGDTNSAQGAGGCAGCLSWATKLARGGIRCCSARLAAVLMRSAWMTANLQRQARMSSTTGRCGAPRR